MEIDEQAFDEWFLPLVTCRNPASSFRYALGMYLQNCSKQSEKKKFFANEIFTGKESGGDGIALNSMSMEEAWEKHGDNHLLYGNPDKNCTIVVSDYSAKTSEHVFHNGACVKCLMSQAYINSMVLKDCPTERS